MISSLLSTTFTKPTGTPMISAGCSLPASISSLMAIRAVGALPMAKMQGFPSFAAFSMETMARVMPRSLASAATSGSDMKQCTSPPSLPRMVLLIPALAIWVSVTISQPPRRAAMPLATAPSEKVRFLA